jgi:hypothetical protein
MRFLACLALLASLGNVAYFAWWVSTENSDRPIPPVAHKDTDGDGIPDHHDFCPVGARRWSSSRRTDYDQDGCEDDSEEDDDKDGDRVKDAKDSCPFTPQHYGFTSIPAYDFDGDGCYDRHEDPDDDDDNIPNNMDMCPRTKLNHSWLDPSGCSEEQREHRKRINLQKSAEPPRSKLQVWIATLRANGFEVILGFIIAAAFTKLLAFMKFLTEHSSAERARWLEKLRALLKYSIRSVAFICLILWFRTNQDAQTGAKAVT